jgi:hypothetical protein
VVMVMKFKFGIGKYSQGIGRVLEAYEGSVTFVTTCQHVGFLEGGYSCNFSCTHVDFSYS